MSLFWKETQQLASHVKQGGKSPREFRGFWGGH